MMMSGRIANYTDRMSRTPGSSSKSLESRPVKIEAGVATPGPGGSVESSEVLIRRLSHRDSMEEITSLLHRAYAKQVEMGLKPLAGRQDVATTKRRCSSGECYVATLRVAAVPPAKKPREQIVGIILFHEVEPDEGPAWFQRAEVDSFSQFAVDPDVQGKGIGRKLLETVERRAKECNAAEIACSMADPDTELKNFYLKRGYRQVELWQWPYTNYKSAILSKTL
jgi:GNAT superfamily N-acetyltransferase